MSDETAYLEQIKLWLASYADDARRVRAAMISDAPSPRACHVLAGTLNYQLRKMDLTPDWTPEIGMVDDVMVLRTGASVFKNNNVLDLPPDIEQTIEELSKQDEMVKNVLGEDLYERLFEHVKDLRERTIHGRDPEQIVENAAVREAFLGELDRYIARYQVPQISDPGSFLPRVRSYISAKLG